MEHTTVRRNVVDQVGCNNQKIPEAACYYD